MYGIYIVSELFVDIGKSPYALSLKGIFTNVFIYILPIVAKEYTRFKLINNVYEKDKKFIAVIVTCIYVFVDIGTIDVTSVSGVIKLLFSDFIPAICINILCTYMAINRAYKPAIFYRSITSVYWLISPYLPKVTWVITTFVDSAIPAILFVYIRYLKMKNDVKKDKKQIEVSNPKSIIPLVVGVVLILWFGTGVFPVRPVAVATGSMEKTLMVGDVVILKKCTINDLEVGDIVQYQKDDFTVIHRVISKYYEDGKWFLITKGDNNSSEDFLPVAAEQVIAKEMFSIRYLGLPAVWLNNMHLFSSPDTSSIEKGV